MSDSALPVRLRASQRGAGVLLLLALLAVPFAARVTIDNRIELWVSSETATARSHARLVEAFGSDEFVLVAYAGADWLSESSLDVQEAVLEALEALPHVRRVAGPPAVRRDLLYGDDPELLREELLATPFYRRFLVAEDGSAAGLLIETSLPSEPAARVELVRGIRNAVAPLRDAGLEVHVVGPPVLNAALDLLSRREGSRAFPIAFALSLAVVTLAFRSWRPAVVTGSCAGLALLLTFGLVGAAGRPLNLVTAVLPSLLWVLALAGVVHLLARESAHRARGLEPAAALEAALRDVAGPSVLAAVTTALGFTSLLAAELRPVQELGVFAAAGLLLSLAVNLTVGPLLLRRLPHPVGRPPAGAVWFAGLGAFATRRPASVLALAVSAVIAVVLLLPRLDVESDPLAFLPADSETSRAYAFVAERLSGYYAVELLIEGGDHWLEPARWPVLERVARTLEEDPGVARVLSPLDFLKHLNFVAHGRDQSHYALPPDRETARRLLDGFDLFGEGERTRLVADAGHTVRLSALVRVMPSDEFERIVALAEVELASLPPPSVGRVTGIVRRLVEAQLALLESQIRSFGLAFATVFLCVAVGLRSLRLLAVSILPNLLPVAAAFAGMVLLGVALDAATVMVASVAIGIAVDDTVHLLGAWRRERSGAASGGEAARAALAEVGPAMAVTTAAGCAGFLSLATSAFAPIRWLGLLGALALATALLADVLVAPAMLATRIGDART